jgi:hypothetical protein
MDKIGHPKKRAFLAAYSNCGVVRLACAASGVAHGSYYGWIKKDPRFAAAVSEAKEEFIEHLEVEADRRAVEGVRRLKFHGKTGVVLRDEHGKVYEEREYSDTLLIFRLKALRPEMYRENYTLKVSDERLKAETDRMLELVRSGRGMSEDVLRERLGVAITALGITQAGDEGTPACWSAAELAHDLAKKVARA